MNRENSLIKRLGPIGVAFLLVLGGNATAEPDLGIDVVFEDDVTIKGRWGTAADPDFEVYGFSCFGTNALTAVVVTSGIGSAFFSGSVEISSNLWIQSALGVGILSNAPRARIDSRDNGLPFLGERISSLTTSPVASLVLQHSTTEEMKSQFGVESRFVVKDKTTEQTLGGVRGRWDEDEGGGSIELFVQKGSTQNVGVMVHPGGTVSFPSQSLVRVYRSTSQTIPRNVWTRVNFNEKNVDVQNEYQVDSSSFIAKTDGYYVVSASASFNQGTAGRSIAIYRNGILWSYGSTIRLNTAQIGRVNIMDIVPLSAGDYIEVFVWQNSNGDLTLLEGADQTYLSIYKGM